MEDVNKEEKPIITVFIKGCSLLSAALGILAILGWVFDIPQLASFDPNLIPMALSTSILFVTYGLIIFFHNQLFSSRIMFRIVVVISSIGMLMALLLLYFSLNGIRPEVEHLGMKMNGIVDGLVAGHISPVTAFCFVLISASFLIMRTNPKQKKQIKTSLILAVLVFFISIILLLSYLLGTPLLYEGSFIPPALTTSLALLFLGTPLLYISVLKVWSPEEIADVLSTRYTYILALIFFVLTSSIITVGYSYYKNYEKQYRSGVQYQLSSIALLKVHQIEQWRKERLGDAKAFYKNVEFSKLVKQFFNKQNDLESKKRIQAWIDQARSGYQYNRVSLFYPNGDDVISSPDEKSPKPFIFSLFSSIALKSGQIVFEDFYRDVNDNNIYLTILIPIFSEQSDQDVIGILALRIDPAEYLYPLINEWPTPSKTAETLLIRREGNNALFLNELKFQKNTALNLRRPLSEINLPAAQAALGKVEFMEGIDYRGIPVIAYVCPILNSPWYLVARMDISEIYAPLREWFWAIVILVAGLLIGSGASIGLIWRQQRSKFIQERFQSTENIKKLNRVYAVLSEINEAIVRIRNPQELFEKACDIAVEKGGFQMAWIGKINSQTKMVEVVASKGVSEAHLKKIDFNCESDESQLGIAGRAIKTGVHVISYDIQNDETILPPHNESVMYGSKSFAAFPIKIFGQVWGVFKLYSSEIGFFDKEELKLLDKLAMDISFAIEFAEKETERKLAEDALKQANIELENLHNNLDEAIFAVDIINNKMLQVSIANETVFGYSQAAFFNNTQLWYEIIVPEDKPIVDAGYPILWAGQILRHEYRIVRSDKQIRWIEAKIKPTLDTNGKLIRIDGIASDITERKRAEETLKKLSSAVEQTVDSIIITDRDGNIEYVNRAFEDLTGYSSEEAVGKTPRILKSGTIDQKYYEEMWKQILSGKVLKSEVINKKKDGSLYDEEITISPIFDINKNITHFVGTGVDITERKLAEKELIDAKERAEESDKLKTEFLAQMSHEIRTPINIMIGNVDYLNQSFGENMDSEARDCFDGIDLASKRIIRTVDLILNTAELRASSYKPQFVKIDLNSKILKKLYQEHQLSAKQNGIELNYTCLEKDTDVISDEYSITQIFANLIDNAIKYTKKGKVEILLEKNKTGNIVVEVKDTGIGISEKHLPKIFEPFTQEEQGYSRSFEGNGLGLALVKRYCELNNIIIEVESEKNVGSTFRIIFGENITEAQT
jgi:PAS domain S-box-containing protein